MTSILSSYSRWGYDPVPETQIDDPALPPAPQHWAAHPDAQGLINKMLVRSGRLHLAHGSWSGGAHRAAYVDIAAATPVSGRHLASEGFATIAEYDGRLFLPWQDPTGSWSAKQGYSFSDDNGTTWIDVKPFLAYHVFDITKHEGTLFLCGGMPAPDGGQQAFVWASPDAGETWSESLVLPGAPGRSARIYAFSVIDGRLVVAPEGTQDTTSREWTGAEWVPSTLAAPIAGFREPGMVVNTDSVSYGQSAAATLDGVIEYGRTQPLYPAWADTGHVYALDPSTGSVLRAPLFVPGDSAVAWATWLPLPEGVLGYSRISSALLHDGFVYVGGSQGRIWRTPAPPA